jgi:deazaflavin-dependent oxidoreductase (nitroreductase family)
MSNDFARWLYRGSRPNWLAKAANRLGATLSSLGIGPKIMITLEVVGRKSGKTISLPLVIVALEKQRYLVSMLGEHVRWVQNVRAADGEAVISSGKREEVRLEEIPVDQRAPILKAFLQRAPGARPHMPISKDAPLADFEKIAASYPVFHVTSRLS